MADVLLALAGGLAGAVVARVHVHLAVGVGLEAPVLGGPRVALVVAQVVAFTGVAVGDDDGIGEPEEGGGGEDEGLHFC